MGEGGGVSEFFIFYTMNPNLFIYFYFSLGSGVGVARQVVPGQPFRLLSF